MRMSGTREALLFFGLPFAGFASAFCEAAEHGFAVLFEAIELPGGDLLLYPNFPVLKSVEVPDCEAVNPHAESPRSRDA